ncbi:hypothetical protein Agub_g13743 [Astrephomene gubernaculifera]|uniref:Uncharacterized protein n=1 Tax=Astrephomene gubernaculifera TaxID=47775 RepID=A0AAD3E0K8_9CHLO|nr:hypothetical protein Agub_g13743 [Astrephomene gubernaculifera]
MSLQLFSRRQARSPLQPCASLAPHARPAVLITGASTGIGKATALHLSKNGWQVFAGVRREADGAALTSLDPSIVPLLLDVTSDESTAAAVSELKKHLQGPQPPPTTATGSFGDEASDANQSSSTSNGNNSGNNSGCRNLSGLVNNAGKGLFAPLELMPLAAFEDVMSVNVTGVLRVTQAVLPLLKKTQPHQQPGRIVNIGSYAGSIALPLFGAYATSKFGLEALSDVMRYELGPKFGIRTALIKAGGVRTPIWDKSVAASEVTMGAAEEEAMRPYREMCEEIIGLSRAAEENGISADKVAEIVAEALTAANPKSRYLIGNGGAEWEMTARRLLPDWIWDKLLLSKLVKTRQPFEQS